MQAVFSALCLAFAMTFAAAESESLKGWTYSPPTATPTYWGGLWAPTPEPTHYGGWAGTPTAPPTSLHCQNGHTPIVPSSELIYEVEHNCAKSSLPVLLNSLGDSSKATFYHFYEKHQYEYPPKFGFSGCEGHGKRQTESGKDGLHGLSWPGPEVLSRSWVGELATFVIAQATVARI